MFVPHCDGDRIMTMIDISRDFACFMSESLVCIASFVMCDMVHIEPMHPNKHSIVTYLLMCIADRAPPRPPLPRETVPPRPPPPETDDEEEMAVFKQQPQANQPIMVRGCS